MSEYSVGDFVYHLELGTGQIISITPGAHPDLTIAFERSPRHTISAYLAERSTSRLSPSGFRAMAYADHAVALEYLEKTPAEAIRLVLQDFPDTKAKTPEIHEYLMRHIRDWEKWWKRAQKALKDSPQIDTSRSRQQEYRLSGVALSRAEELYEAFWRSTVEAATGIRPEDHERVEYELALRVLGAFSEGAFLPPEKEEVLRDFLIGEVTRPNLPVGIRLDALFRCVERHWLSKEETGKSISGMISPELELSAMEPLVRSRLVDHFLACDRSDLTDRILITGLRSSPEEARRIGEWVLAQADSRLVVDSVFHLLRTSIESADAPRSAESQLIALQSLIRLLPAVSSDPTVWREIGTATVALGTAIAAQVGPRLRGEVPRLVTIAAMVATRAGEAGVDCQEPLAKMLVNPARRSEFALMVLGCLDQALPEFTEEVHRAFYASFLPSSRPALDALAQRMGLAELVSEAAGIERDNKALWAGISSVIVRTVSGGSNEALLAWLTTIETVCLVDPEAKWRTSLDALRERAYEAILSRALGSDPKGGEITSRVLDEPAMTAIVRFLREQEAEMARELQNAREALAEVETNARKLETDLQSRETIVGELGGRISRGAQDAKHLERVRILKSVAQTTAELERYVFVRRQPFPELRGTLTRLTSILTSFGVEPTEGPGETIPWDVSSCQWADGEGTTMEAGAPVRVEERGYFIKDPAGIRRLLKPAIVGAPEGTTS